MKASNTRARKFSLTVGKIMMALVFISMIGGTFITPAFGRDNRRQDIMIVTGMNTADECTTISPAIIRGLSICLHRSSMTHTRISHRASASSSPSVFDRESLCVRLGSA